jgi:hypothetical protein
MEAIPMVINAIVNPILKAITPGAAKPVEIASVVKKAAMAEIGSALTTEGNSINKSENRNSRFIKVVS